MPHDRDTAARIARELIQAAGPPDETNETVYDVVEQFAAVHDLTPRDIAGITSTTPTATPYTESHRHTGLPMANDHWRFRCPREHTNWEPQGAGIYCNTCLRDGVGPAYGRVWDARRGELLAADAIAAA